MAKKQTAPRSPSAAGRVLSNPNSSAKAKSVAAKVLQRASKKK